MPRFSFSIEYGTTMSERVDLDLPDLRSAWSEAVTSCGETLEEIDGNFGLTADLVMTVSDAVGKHLFELRCSSQHFFDLDKLHDRIE
jgi:hypothetical protein